MLTRYGQPIIVLGNYDSRILPIKLNTSIAWTKVAFSYVIQKGKIKLKMTF